jgi:hypothetical protein
MSWHLAVLGLLIAVSGCGDPRYVQVKGRVTYKGQPVPSTYVTFVPPDGSRHSRGLTDEKGEFTLRNSHQQMGVLLGHHTVYLTYNPSGEEENGKGTPRADKQMQKAIARHGDPSKTELQADVIANGQFIEIKLD